VSVNLRTGTATGDGNDVLFSIENVIGGSSNDTIIGDVGNNVLSGGAGDDSLSGVEGDDRLDGGLGVDTADYGSATAGVSVNLRTGTAAGDGNDVLVSIENVRGGRGNDTISGFGGDDRLDGGLGADTADYGSATAVVSVNLMTGTATGDGNDVLISIENVRGGSGNDTIIGDAQNNYIYGGTGADVLTGNGGADSFLFSNQQDFGSASSDFITDFSGEDIILVSASGFGITASSDKFILAPNALALSIGLSTEAMFVYDSSNGHLFWNENGSIPGAGAGGIFAVLVNKFGLGSSNINLAA